MILPKSFQGRSKTMMKEIVFPKSVLYLPPEVHRQFLSKFFPNKSFLILLYYWYILYFSPYSEIVGIQTSPFVRSLISSDCSRSRFPLPDTGMYVLTSVVSFLLHLLIYGVGVRGNRRLEDGHKEWPVYVTPPLTVSSRSPTPQTFNQKTRVSSHLFRPFT